MVALTTVVGVVCFGGGWFLGQYFKPIVHSQSLRVPGYQFIDPLLACNINNTKVFPEDTSLNNALDGIISINTQDRNISKASAYFLNLSNGKWANVNPTETYYPSSLGKIPIMIAYYEEAESNPDILNQSIFYAPGSADLNDTQDIPPPEAIVPGQS